MTFIHPNLSEHYGARAELAGLADRINSAGDHLELAAALDDATALPPVELRRVMRTLARREGGASIHTAHELAARRLRAMLQLDVEAARVIARAFSDAFVDLPDRWQERNREIDLSVIKNALHAREFLALTEMLPQLNQAESASWLQARLDSERAADASPTSEPTQALIERM